MGAYGIPLPPEVASQMPSMGQYAGGLQQQQAPGIGGPQQGGAPDPSAFANEALNSIAEQLTKVAQVILQTRPELGPIIQKMAEAGSMLQSQLSGAHEEAGEAGAVQSPPTANSPQDVPMA